MGGEQNLKKTIKTDISMALFGTEKQKSSRQSRKRYTVDLKVSCEHCSRSFKTTEHLNRHTEFCKLKRLFSRWKFDGEKLCIEEEPIEEISTHEYTCYYCDFVFYNEKHYYEHMRNFRYECRMCQTHFDNNHFLKTHYCLKFLKDLRNRMATPILEAADTPKNKDKNELGSK